MMNPISNHIQSSLTAGRIQKGIAADRASTMHKLATGQRINRAADDPAGLITSENLRAALASFDAEIRALQRADHVANTADGALREVSGLINRAEALILANANTTGLSDAERQANQMELDSLVSSIDRIAGSATFNGRKLFDGTMSLTSNGESVTFDAIHAENLGEIEVDGQTYSMAELASGRSSNIVNGDLAEAQETLQAARDQINSLRGRIGSFQKDIIATRLNSLGVAIENIASAESEIRDADYARETADLSRLNLLHEVSIRNIGLINSRAKNVLNLLG